MMKTLSLFFLLVISFTVNAQNTYQVLTDSAEGNAKMLKGIISKGDLSSDSLFSWYAESQRIYPHPDTAAVAAFRKNKDKIYFIIFGGTWCLFATDRYYRTTGNIAQALQVTNVPTIIVMKDGKELGRVVEYGKTGKWDKELADIINE